MNQMIRFVVNHHNSLIINRLMPIILIQNTRKISKNYDKIQKLIPPQIKYDKKNPRFMPKPQPEDDAYIKMTDDEIYELTNVKLESQYKDTVWTQIDVNEHPFREVLKDDPNNRFTNVTVIDDPNRWFWVQRLMPKSLPPEISQQNYSSTPLPSGYSPPPINKPDLPYFISRTRSKLYPVYRKYELPEGSIVKGVKGWIYNQYKRCLIPDPHPYEFPDPIITTEVRQIKGEIWQLEEDLRGALEMMHQKRILSACNEVHGVLRLKGDFMMDVVEWLKNKGF